MNAPRSSSPHPPPGTEVLRGVLERIIFFNEENQYCIAELRDEKTERSAIITGTMPRVQCGESLRVSGTWTRHPRHGDQFRVRDVKSELPATVYGIRRYLGSGLVPGIGKVYANKIVDHFGADTFRVISEESGRLRDVPGIGKGRAHAIKEAWEEQRAVREVMVFLQTYGVSPAQCVRLVKHYGNQAQTVLRNEPYRVAREIDGIGFKTADRIAINLGYANDSPPRLEAGILFALAELESEGHTAFPEVPFLDHAGELLETDREKLERALANLVEKRAVIRLPDDGRLQLPGSWRAEKKIAEAVLRLSRNPGSLPPIRIDKALEWAQERAGFAFGAEQAEGVRKALTDKVSILTGGPGTGKTTILRALTDILRAKKVSLQMAAPTGRAAQRLSETTGIRARTIHRLLKFDPAENAFSVNEDHPLKTDFVIVDEASMLDARLAAGLFQAIPSRSRLLLVGDIDQLPSVGAGNVLNDLIKSPVPNLLGITRLENIFRQKEKSAIVTTAHAINAGRVLLPPRVSEPEELDPQADLQFVETPTPEDCLEKLLRLCGEVLPERFRVHPVREAQVLAPMHKGVVGIVNLNTELQRTLNPAGAGGDAVPLAAGGPAYRRGDKLIQLRNNYEKNIFNGDLGTVTAVDPEEGVLTADFDGESHRFERAELGDLSLAYAITIHKSQGSEYPVVIIPILKQHYMMLRRNLVYTAITRARRKVILLGDPAAYAMAVRNNDTRTRHTCLLQQLRSISSSHPPDAP